MRSIWIGACAAVIVGIGLDELWRHLARPIAPSVGPVLVTNPSDLGGGGGAGAASPAKLMTDSEVRDRLEQVYEGSHEAPTWLDRSMQELRQKLASHLPANTSIDSFECREAMCKIESAHADQSSTIQFQMIAFRNPDTALWNAGFFSTRSERPPGDKARVHLVTYLAPPNQTLPIVNNYPNHPNNSSPTVSN